MQLPKYKPGEFRFRQPWRGTVIPDFMQSVLDRENLDPSDRKHRFRIGELYAEHVSQLREAALTNTDGNQLFVEVRLSVSFFAEYSLHIYGDNVFFNIHREGANGIPIRRLENGEHYSQLKNSAAYERIKPDLFRLDVLNWELSSKPSLGFDGWSIDITLSCDEGAIEAGGWLKSPPDYVPGDLSSQVIDLLSVIGVAYGFPAIGEEFTEVGQRINKSNPIPGSVIGGLLALGNTDSLEQLKEHHRDPLTREGGLRGQHHSIWEPLARSLSEPDLASLFRGLVIVDRELDNWSVGSVAPAIAIFHIYKERFKDYAGPLSEWAIQNRGDNTYIR